MRKIKFRGKNIKTNKWEHGDLLQAPAQKQAWIFSSLNKQVIPESVGQYSEQNDVNGNEIYEGMNVRQVNVLVGTKDRDFTGVVKFYDGTWWIDSGTDAVELFTETCKNTIITGEE
ncbi:YopX family protein [Clostridium lacusfryxellense]|uniref:YopX family protein n=1 Tax=Clostridium lacusfryxellense TaxID=205328 RepID=UPI001C0BEF1C|nr:YopX family protein [Clostridium lacusfryxellense]MBU3111978.1 hypothetical protein [Clostridium lacusfryxellense]